MGKRKRGCWEEEEWRIEGEDIGKVVWYFEFVCIGFR